jgi:GTP pyrophosphokinase
VPLETALQNGDVVEVFTSKDPNAGPNQNWLSFVQSKRAQNKIRQWFTKERREEAAETGKVEITKALRKQGLPLHQVMNSAALQQVALQLRYADVTALYAAVGEGHVSAQSVIEKVTALVFDEQTSTEPALSTLPIIEAPRASKTGGESGVVVKGASDVLAKLAKCCTPVPGDEILGFVTKGQGVSVHRVDCHNFLNLREQQERVVEVEWAPSSKSVFLVQIQVEALDRSGLLSDVTRTLSEHHVNILSASVNTSSSRLAISRFVFEMANATHLEHVLNAVRRIDGVYDVYRIQS